jgi:hypothetical protein
MLNNLPGTRIEVVSDAFEFSHKNVANGNERPTDVRLIL